MSFAGVSLTHRQIKKWWQCCSKKYSRQTLSFKHAKYVVSCKHDVNVVCMASILVVVENFHMFTF